MNGIWKEREALINGSISGAENLYFKIQGIAQVNLPKSPVSKRLICYLPTRDKNFVRDTELEQ